MKRQPIITIIVAGVLTVTMVVAFFLYRSGESNQQQLIFDDNESNLSFEYSPDMQLSPMTDADREDRFIVRLEPVGSESTRYLISVRAEAGFEKLSNITNQSPLDIIVGNVNRSYPERFPGFTNLRQQNFSLGGVNAAEVIFTYDASGGRIKQHLLILMRSPDEAVYFSQQALETEFDGIDAQYFTPIRDSISFN